MIRIWGGVPKRERTVSIRSCRKRNGRIQITLTGIVLIGVAIGAFIHVNYSQWRLERAEREIRRFEELVGRLLTDNRRATFYVTDQWMENGEKTSSILWLEYDSEGKPLCEHVINLNGREVFVDAVRVQYEYEALQVNESHNFSIFRRIFSDRMRPVDGYPLYPVSLEGVERKALENLPPREREAFREQIALLGRYIEDPGFAQTRKVRMIEGEAKYTLLEPGYLYTVSQQSAGGLVLDRQRLAAAPPPTAGPDRSR